MFTSWRQVFPTWVHKFLSWKHKIHRYEKTNLQAGENKSVGSKKNPRSTSLGDWEYQKFPKTSSSSSNSGAPTPGVVTSLPKPKRYCLLLSLTTVKSGLIYFVLFIIFSSYLFNILSSSLNHDLLSVHDIQALLRLADTLTIQVIELIIFNSQQCIYFRNARSVATETNT